MRETHDRGNEDSEPMQQSQNQAGKRVHKQGAETQITKRMKVVEEKN